MRDAARRANLGATMTTLRLGTVPYLNAAPLLGGLDDEPRVELSHAVPSQLAVSSAQVGMQQ